MSRGASPELGRAASGLLPGLVTGPLSAGGPSCAAVLDPVEKQRSVAAWRARVLLAPPAAVTLEAPALLFSPPRWRVTLQMVCLFWIQVSYQMCFCKYSFLVC